MKARALAMTVLLLAAQGVCAGELESWAAGHKEYKAGDYGRALPLLQSAANEGNAHAMNLLGQMCVMGQGVPRDYTLALDWFQKAAAKDNAPAKNNLGELYANGWGVPQDFGSAVRWFDEAARSGDGKASYNLGKSAALGMGIGKNPERAAQLFRDALKADPQNAKCRNWLGSVYFDQGQFEEAAKQFQAVTQNGASPAEIWHFYLGESLLRLGRMKEARAAFVAARFDPADANRGKDYAAEIAEELKRIDAYDERYSRAIVLLATRDLEGARKELTAALAIIDSVEGREKLAAVEAAQVPGLRRGYTIGIVSFLAAIALAVIGLYLSRRQRRAPRLLESGDSKWLDKKFELRGIIGQGGMGQVYEAYDHALDRKVAVKKMLSDLQSVPENKERFLNEARVIARLSHPFIVGIHAVVEEEGCIYLVLDYVDGKPLSSHLDDDKRLGLVVTQGILNQVCQAVEYAHRNHVLHRDLKPSNILMDSSGFAKVTDFGLARIVKDSLSGSAVSGMSGTPAFMAPEQHLGHSKKESDIYAVGVCLYQMLTGQLPFSGGDILAQKERMHFPKPTQLVPDLPKAVDELVAKALHSDPTQRPRSADELLRLLLNCR